MHMQTRIQRLKELVKLTRFQFFLLLVPGYQDIPSLSFALRYQR